MSINALVLAEHASGAIATQTLSLITAASKVSPSYLISSYLFFHVIIILLFRCDWCYDINSTIDAMHIHFLCYLLHHSDIYKWSMLSLPSLLGSKHCLYMISPINIIYYNELFDMNMIRCLCMESRELIIIVS